MLEIIKTTQFRGDSKINTQSAKVFEATINTAAPENMTLNSYIINYDLYKSNRTAIAADQAAFEDAVYAFQEALIAEQAAR
ncbi:MAG: hypothetical protein PWQ06_110 [Anaerophaga sp.]|nr:hypothetical protein [Anaerophaga sp.]